MLKENGKIPFMVKIKESWKTLFSFCRLLYRIVNNSFTISHCQYFVHNIFFKIVQCGTM
jgi:hypothetical protein